MANTYKNIVITPNIGSGTDDPRIQFSGGNTSVNTDITLRVYPTSNGTLSFEGSAGQLFSITNDLTGTIFSVNDVSGIPSLEVNADGLVKIAEFGGNVAVGRSNANYKLDVFGTINASNILINQVPLVTSTTLAGANAAVGAGANTFASATIAGANTAVGAGANAFASATVAGANTAVGAAANNFAIATFGAANTRPVGNTLSNSFTSRSTRRTLNFIPGSNITINVDDDSAGDRSNVTITSTGGGVTTFSAGTTGFTPSSATAGAVTLAGTLGISNGGTGQTSAHLAMAALEGSQRQSIATAGGTTTLTVNSPRRILFTGTQAQTVVLPVVSTLALGVYFEIATSVTTNSVQVQSSGGNAITTVGRGHIIRFTCILTTGTTAASWDWEVVGSYNGYAGNGSLVFANSPNITSPNVAGDMTIASGNLLISRTTSTVGLNTKLDINGAVNASAFLINGVALSAGGDPSFAFRRANIAFARAITA